MTPAVPALASGTRRPIPFNDEQGIPCLRVPLDDTGRDFAIVERSDYLHIAQTLGCRASWFMAGRPERQYVQLNAPKIDGKGGGILHVARLFPGVKAERVRYLTDDTQDLRRCNLAYRAGDERTRRNASRVVVDAVTRRKSRNTSKKR